MFESIHLLFIDPRHGEFRCACDLSSTSSASEAFPKCKSEKAHLGVSIVQLLLENPPIRWKELHQTSRFLQNRESRIVDVCGSRLNPSTCLMAIPDTPSTHQVPGILRQSRTSTKHTSGTQKSQKLHGNVGCFRAVRCLQIAKKILLLIQSIHLDLQSAESGSKSDPQQMNLLAFEQRSSVELFPSLHGKILLNC